MSGTAHDAPADQAADADEGSEKSRPAPTRGRVLAEETTRVRLAGVLLVALVAGLVACGALAWQGSEEPSTLERRAAARDEARSAALRDVETLMTADHRDAAGTFESWTGITTGRLHAQLAEQRKTILTRLRATKEVTTVRTIEAALSSWDEAAGTARLLAVLELRTASKDTPTTRTVRYLAMTQRIDGKWLLSAVQQVGAAS